METVCIVVLIGLLVYQSYHARKREKKLAHRIQKMIDDAIAGKFQEKHLEETHASEIESNMWRFLNDCQVSSLNLKEQKQCIQTLISDISHQTVTPISNMKIYTELLEERHLLDPKGVKELQAIGEQVEELEFLIDSLVKLSRLETGIISVNVQKESIEHVFAALEKKFKGKAEQKGITLTIEPSKEEAVFDVKWTKEAIANLVDNAIKYTPQGGQVHIQAVSYSMFLRVDIKDTGIGISEADQAKIFTRFYRSRAVRGKEGVGIGLYLAREILKEEDAYIKVSSEEGHGSTFSVFLLR